MKCKSCHGSGTKIYGEEMGAYLAECKECGGTGEVVEKADLRPCPFCGKKVKVQTCLGHTGCTLYKIKHDCNGYYGVQIETGTSTKLQEIIDMWNGK